MQTPSFKLACLAAGMFTIAAAQLVQADSGGINSLVQSSREYSTPLKPARLVAAAMLTFDTLDSVEKLLLKLDVDSKRQLETVEQKAETHPRDERAVRVQVAMLRRRTLTGMPLTMLELKRRYHEGDGFGYLNRSSPLQIKRAYLPRGLPAAVLRCIKLNSEAATY